MNHRYTKIIPDTVGCHPAALAGSRCRVSDYNNIINIIRPEPDTC